MDVPSNPALEVASVENVAANAYGGDRVIPRVSSGGVRPRFAILPSGAKSETRLLLAARGLRAIGDGFVSLLLPVYLLELGHGPFETGIIATTTLAGSALLTLLVGLYAQRASGRSLLIGAALLMVLTGIAFADVRGLLAAPPRRFRRHLEPVFGRRQRLPAAGAGPARPDGK